jgi:hypothetical protein
MFLVGINYTFSSYATGGLETQMQTALFTMSCYYCLRESISKEWKLVSVAILSLLLTLALLTRLDSTLLCLVIVPATIFSISANTADFKARALKLSVLLTPPAIIIGTWFGWKLSYYGNILPNTFYIKASSITSLSSGVHYLYRFIDSYLLLPFIIIGIFVGRTLIRKFERSWIIPMSIMLLWLLYIIKVGGDFMEFRLFVPIIPFIYLSIGLLLNSMRSNVLRIALVVLAVGGTLHHGLTFRLDDVDRIEPIRELNGHLFNQDEQWASIGEVIGKELGYDSTVTIATTAAGAIPYYARMRTVDMLGINDKWVAHYGKFIGTIPGHQRMSPYSYLLQRQVNLVISHPTVLKLSSPSSYIPLIPRSANDVISHAKIVEIPLDEQYKVICMYLVPHPTIEHAIEQYHWRVHTITTNSNNGSSDEALVVR